jgi:hypothetical protein
MSKSVVDWLYQVGHFAEDGGVRVISITLDARSFRRLDGERGCGPGSQLTPGKYGERSMAMVFPSGPVSIFDGEDPESDALVRRLREAQPKAMAFDAAMAEYQRRTGK